MKLDTDLNEFNRRFAEEMLPFFPDNVEACQSDDGTLLFRGPIPNSDDGAHVGTHVSVELAEDVKAALENAGPPDRKEMIENLISNLGGQIRARYDRSFVGQFALPIKGNIAILKG